MRQLPEHPTAPPGDGYMDRRQAAAYMNISPRTLTALVSAHEIEFIRARGRQKFTRAACDRYMRERTIAPGRRR